MKSDMIRMDSFSSSHRREISWIYCARLVASFADSSFAVFSSAMLSLRVTNRSVISVIFCWRISCSVRSWSRSSAIFLPLPLPCPAHSAHSFLLCWLHCGWHVPCWCSLNIHRIHSPCAVPRKYLFHFCKQAVLLLFGRFLNMYCAIGVAAHKIVDVQLSKSVHEVFQTFLRCQCICPRTPAFALPAKVCLLLFSLVCCSAVCDCQHDIIRSPFRICGSSVETALRTI